MAKKPESEKTEDEKREEEILRRMLNTPPTPHKPKPSKDDGPTKKPGK